MGVCTSAARPSGAPSGFLYSGASVAAGISAQFQCQPITPKYWLRCAPMRKPASAWIALFLSFSSVQLIWPIVSASSFASDAIDSSSKGVLPSCPSVWFGSWP